MYPPGPEPIITTSNLSITICHSAFAKRIADATPLRASNYNRRFSPVYAEVKSDGFDSFFESVFEKALETARSCRAQEHLAKAKCSSNGSGDTLALKIQREFFRILDALLHFYQEGNRFFAVDGAVIVAQPEIHLRAHLHAAVPRHWAGHDFVHAQNAALRRIQNRSGE